MNSVEKKNGKLELSPTKQRTPRQLPHQKDVGIYFAQSKDTIAISSIMSDSSESDGNTNDTETSEDDFLKKRKKRIDDPMAKKLTKIRKTFDNNVSFANEEDADSQLTDSLSTVSSEQSSSKKIQQDSLSSNIELTVNDKSTGTLTDGISKENVVDSQATDMLEGLDNMFEEEWSYKKETSGELDDLFEDDWSYEQKSTIDFSTPKRCIIIDIIWDKSEVTLTVKDALTDVTETVICYGIWRYTKIEPGEAIVIKAKKESKQSKHWTVDNNFGWIINQADTLISGTSVVGALFCHRKSIFSEKFRNLESLPYYQGGNHFMLTGSLTHELLQTVLEKDIKDVKKISALLDDILKSKHAIQMMYCNEISAAECKNLMRPAVAQIYKFLQRYINGVQPEVADQNFDGKIEKICDIEENVWLPSLGLKGKIDLTVEVSSRSKNKLFPSVERRILPLELKTGKSSFSNEHQGQLILYTMMMNMTGRKANSGLLLYLRENIMREIVGSHNAQRDLITLRNTVAYYTTRQPAVVEEKDKEDQILPMEFPKPISHPACANCSYNVLCSAYLTEDDHRELSGNHALKDISEKVFEYLDQQHIEYVKKWVSLIQLEEITENQRVSSWSDVWTLKPTKREKRGSCICNLNLVSVSKKSGRYLHEFQRAPSEEGDPSPISIVDFCEQDYVIISTNDRINICSGYIDSLSSSAVSVHCEKDITKVYKDTVFHIDKSLTSSLQSYNLSQLGGLLDDQPICKNLREIIIDRRPATFKAELPAAAFELGDEILSRLNENQRQAVFKTLEADDYLLIKGFPGTGKTQTLVAIIELLVKLGKSVLVTAHTNTAVDNILLKLMERDVDFLRCGSSARIHPELLHKLDDNVTAHCDSPESLHTVYCSKQVFGVTCYGSNHPHLSRRKFDICIVDESTQVLQPTILRPLFSATKFLLVGDPEQLPPIAKNNTAKKLGMNESLFSRLDSENNSVVLTSQYRMNKCIMDIANKLTYHDQLEVGNESIGNATLPITNVGEFELCERWIRKTLSLRLKNSAIFLNTSATYHLTLHPDLAVSGRSNNYWEAVIILRLIKVLTNLGIKAQTIGVIAPYRAQVSLLRTIFSNDIEVNTVDQYQGRDKSVIIYSCSKSISTDTDIQEFDILEDHQRLTVAVTRAKHKLIIVGDLTTLQRYKPFNKLITAFKNHDRIYDLKDGEDDFCFDDLIRLLL